MLDEKKEKAGRWVVLMLRNKANPEEKDMATDTQFKLLSQLKYCFNQVSS